MKRPVPNIIHQPQYHRRTRPAEQGCMLKGGACDVSRRAARPRGFAAGAAKREQTRPVHVHVHVHLERGWGGARGGTALPLAHWPAWSHELLLTIGDGTQPRWLGRGNHKPGAYSKLGAAQKGQGPARPYGRAGGGEVELCRTTCCCATDAGKERSSSPCAGMNMCGVYVCGPVFTSI